MEQRISWRVVHREPQQLDRLVEVPDSVCNQAQMVEGIRLVGIDLQNLVVELLRLPEASGPMMRHRGIQQALERNRFVRMTLQLLVPPVLCPAHQRTS